MTPIWAGNSEPNCGTAPLYSGKPSDSTREPGVADGKAHPPHRVADS